MESHEDRLMGDDDRRRGQNPDYPGPYRRRGESSWLDASSMRVNGNGNTKWIVVGVLLALGGAFTGLYNFFSDQFASQRDLEQVRAEVRVIRDEQQRRTATVYEVPRRLDSFELKLDRLTGDVGDLQASVAELRAIVVQMPRRPRITYEERPPGRAVRRPESSPQSPTFPSSGFPAHP